MRFCFWQITFDPAWLGGSGVRFGGHPYRSQIGFQNLAIVAWNACVFRPFDSHQRFLRPNAHMKIGVLAEQSPGERRVAISPDSVKAYVRKGASVAIQSGAG